jgi:hypothetical protein
VEDILSARKERGREFLSRERVSGATAQSNEAFGSPPDFPPILLLKEIEMARKDGQYTARIQDDSGTVRGKIPSPLVREMGARPGDYMVFRIDSSGNVTVRLSRTKTGAKVSGRAPEKSGNNGASVTRGRPRKDLIGKRR